MRKLFSTLLFFLLAQLLFSQTGFQEKVTTLSNTRLNVTNIGTFGNAFRGYKNGSGTPSCEYPQGSGIEHLFEGGIWIGAVLQGGDKRVSTSATDAPSGYTTGRSGFEFTTEGGGLQEKSTLFDSPFYSPDAASHQDYVANFTDKNIIIPGTGTQINQHLVPMNLSVNMRALNWNFKFSDFFVIVDFTVINKGTEILDSVHVALWNNTVVRNINVTPAGAGGSAFFAQGGNGYMDSLIMAYCYDRSGDLGFTESYIGQRFLGANDKFGFHHPYNDPTFKHHYNAWQFNATSDPVFFAPSDDAQRYDKLTLGLNDLPNWTGGTNNLQNQLNQSGNRSDLVSVGPFRNFAPGDTINFTFAYVMAKKNEDGLPNSDNNVNQRQNLINNSNWAQVAYLGEDKNFNGILDAGEDLDGDGKITRFILPSPPATPKTKILAKGNQIEIYWQNNAEASIDPITQIQDFEGYKLYLSKVGFDISGTSDISNDLKEIAHFDLPDNPYSFNTGLNKIKLASPIEIEGIIYHYKYVVDKLLSGWQYAVAVTAFDRGNPETNLESLETNPRANNFRVFAGTPPNEDMQANAPFVYPNPYYLGASWEGKSSFQQESRKLIFANLPKRCVIRIFTPAGDLIDEIEHNESYRGEDIRWFKTFGSEDPQLNIFSGGEHAWDLLSAQTQIIARGLYIFTITDTENNQFFKGKFLIIK
jgi:hypothetical protein